MRNTLFNSLFTALAMLVVVAVQTGCATHSPNPSFNVSNDHARAALHEMTEHAKPLPRPLVILGGLSDPGIATMVLGDDFRELTHDDPRVIGVSFFLCFNFDDCRKRVIDAVDKAFPNSDPKWTSEVDVIAVSMGGLVARYAAAEPMKKEASPRRLRIARLFTISSPHRGAALAGLPTLNQLQIDMRAGSKFLHWLDESKRDYKLIPYVRLNDIIVGEQNAAPDGGTAWWVPAEPFQDSHMFAIADPRIVADIARRIRGEPPLTTDPPAPLPAD
jgi:pimeloyl-ACP methyl ester carboxylesterase